MKSMALPPRGKVEEGVEPGGSAALALALSKVNTPTVPISTIKKSFSFFTTIVPRRPVVPVLVDLAVDSLSRALQKPGRCC